jgi:hypothetical protein
VGQIRSALTSVEPNARLNTEGVTPLMVAARMGDAPMVKELLAKGADPSLKNADGKTARDIAGSPEVAKAIESASRNLENQAFKVREDAAATRPAPNNSAPGADHSVSSAPESMFSGSSARAAAAPTAAPAQPTLDTGKSFQSDNAQPQQPQQKSAERAAPEREMSR